MAEEMICEHAGDHRLADRHGADADARIVPALGHDLGVRATTSTPANTNMAEQKKKLMQALAFVIGGLEKTAQLVPTIQNLGRSHVRYGVTDKHCDSVGSALLWTLEQGLKDAWTPAVKDAWVAAYTLVTGVMKDAAKAEMKASA
jgi:hemoglobin-like flavoprotein